MSTDVSEEQVFSTFSVEEYAKQRNQREAGGKQSNRLTEISSYIGNRRKMQASKSVPIGSPTEPNERLGVKNRITRTALKMGPLC
jgi:hypothetical protein